MTTTKMKVLERVLKGYENRRIAEELFISYHTVKAYVAMLLREYDVKNRTALAYKLGFEQGKISVERLWVD